MGGKFLLTLNIRKRPIVQKYREGKMQRTLKRELKVLEIAEREAVRVCAGDWSFGRIGSDLLILGIILWVVQYFRGGIFTVTKFGRSTIYTYGDKYKKLTRR